MSVTSAPARSTNPAVRCSTAGGPSFRVGSDPGSSGTATLTGGVLQYQRPQPRFRHGPTSTSAAARSRELAGFCTMSHGFDPNADRRRRRRCKSALAVSAFQHTVRHRPGAARRPDRVGAGPPWPWHRGQHLHRLDHGKGGTLELANGPLAPTCWPTPQGVDVQAGQSSSTIPARATTRRPGAGQLEGQLPAGSGP